MLIEARDLYLAGHFYSCVAMCGIVGERLVKDVVRGSVLVQKTVHPPQRPSDAAFNQLERVELASIVRFLRESDLLNGEAANAAKKLAELPNDYAHARGKTPPGDALKALKFLHTLMATPFPHSRTSTLSRLEL